MSLRTAFFSAVFAATSLAATALPSTALADVRHEGAWPESEKPVSLDVDGMQRVDAVKKLADAAGWSLMLTGRTASNDVVTLHVKGQSPSKMLDLLLSDGAYVAKRDGTIVALSLATDATKADMQRAADEAKAQDDDAKAMAEDAKKLAAGALHAAA